MEMRDFKELELDLDRFIKKGYYTKDFLLFDIAFSLREIANELKLFNNLFIEKEVD